MSFLLSECKELDFEKLVSVNGGCSGFVLETKKVTKYDIPFSGSEKKDCTSEPRGFNNLGPSGVYGPGYDGPEVRDPYGGPTGAVNGNCNYRIDTKGPFDIVLIVDPRDTKKLPVQGSTYIDAK